MNKLKTFAAPEQGHDNEEYNELYNYTAELEEKYQKVLAAYKEEWEDTIDPHTNARMVKFLKDLGEI